MDRIPIETDALRPIYAALWERVEALAATKSGWSAAGFFARFAPEAKGDHPATLDEHLSMMTATGFTAACVHLHLHRAVFAAAKR